MPTSSVVSGGDLTFWLQSSRIFAVLLQDSVIYQLKHAFNVQTPKF